jgi:hypothetical protein
METESIEGKYFLKFNLIFVVIGKYSFPLIPPLHAVSLFAHRMTLTAPSYNAKHEQK